MKIGIEATHANKIKRTGVEEYCFNIIQELKKIIPQDAEVILYSNENLQGDLKILPQNWKVKILKWPFKKGWSQFRLSLEFIFGEKIDVFFAPGQLIPFICPKNTITMIHDSAFKAMPSAYGFLSRKYLEIMNRLIIKKSKIILTSSNFNKNELEKFYGSKASNKTIVIPLAFDSSKYNLEVKDKQNTESILKKYNIKAPYLISIGRLEEKKNTSSIIKAFDLLKNQNLNDKTKDLSLVLAGGRGVGFEKVEEALEESPYKNKIILPGWVKEEDLPVLLNKAEIFVFPSLYEGFGLPILQAFACGVPVVASAGNALEEVGGNCALYSDPFKVADVAGRITDLLADNDFKNDKITLGLAKVKEFSWQKTAQKTWEIFTSLIQKKD